MTASYINLLIALRWTFHELAWAYELPELAHLIRREDIPRLPYRLPQPLTTEQDQLLQREFLRRNDLGANVFLLIRHTGMRIGECADLAADSLRSTGPDQWAIHVPLGKLKTERLVPVDPFVCKLVHRLRFFRSLEQLPNDGFLLPRPRSKEALIRQLRDYLHQVCHELGLSTRIVPHQFRHTYSSEMLRAGVGLPALMNLLGHVDADMTMRYLDVTLTDLKREFRLARSKPKHLTPQPKPLLDSASNWPQRRHRRTLRCATRAGDVSPHAAKRSYAHLPRPALQPTHKNHRRGKAPQPQLRLGQRLAGKARDPGAIRK